MCVIDFVGCCVFTVHVYADKINFVLESYNSPAIGGEAHARPCVPGETYKDSKSAKQAKKKKKRSS